jgi:hypothetical protein
MGLYTKIIDTLFSPIAFPIESWTGSRATALTAIGQGYTKE